MLDKSSLKQYQAWYARLLRFYPKAYRERFSEELQQTFTDLYRDKAQNNQSSITFLVWIFLETTVHIFKENITSPFMQNLTKRLSIWAAIVLVLLLIPLVAMQFTNEVQWTSGDFIFMGILLFGSACVYELIARKMPIGIYRAGVGLAVFTSFILLWVNAAVGIIGDGPVNLMYLGVIFIGLIGALIARFHSLGMFYTLLAMAITQILVPTLVLIIWGTQISWSPSILGVFTINAGFAFLFVCSALLFHYANNSQTKSHHQNNK